MYFRFLIARFEKSNCDFAELRLNGLFRNGFSLGILVKCVLLDRYTASENTKVGAIAISLALKVKVT